VSVLGLPYHFTLLRKAADPFRTGSLSSPALVIAKAKKHQFP
jgi:hypothetical protein